MEEENLKLFKIKNNKIEFYENEKLTAVATWNNAE